MYDDFSIDHEIVFRYLERKWNKEFEDIEGFKLLQDVTNVFGLEEQECKQIIKDWFEVFTIDDEWFDYLYNKYGLIANELVSVQPLDMPNGNLVYMDMVGGDRGVNVEDELTGYLQQSLQETISEQILQRDLEVYTSQYSNLLIETSMNIDRHMLNVGVRVENPPSSIIVDVGF
jgi:hypothetical protein